MIISCPSCGASFNIQAEALGPNGRTVKCSKCAHRWRATADDGAESPAAASPPAPAPAEEPAPTPEALAPEATTAEASGDAGERPETDSGAVADADAAASDSAIDKAASDEADEAAPPPGLQEALGINIPDGPAEEDAATRRSRSGRRPQPAARKRRRGKAKVLSFFVLLLLISGVGAAAYLMNQKIMMWLPGTQRLYALVGIEPHVLGQGLQIVEPKPKKEIDGNDEILVVEGEIRNTTGAPIDIPLMRGALLDKQGQELHIWTFTAAKSHIAPGELAQYRTEFRNPPPLAESLDITFTRTNAVLEASKHEAKAIPKTAPAAEHKTEPEPAAAPPTDTAPVQ